DLNSRRFHRFGDFDYLFVGDADQFTLSLDYRGLADMDVVMSADGMGPTTIELPPRLTMRGGGVRELGFKGRPSGYLAYPQAGADMTTKDRLYIGRLHLQALEHVSGRVALSQSIYIYRFLDALDSNHHDGVMAFPRATLGVVRHRPFEILTGGLSVP